MVLGAKIAKFKQLLDQSSSILITSHTSPDPDAVCSLLLLGTTLKENFKNKKLEMVLEEMPEGLQDLTGYDSIKNQPLVNSLEELKPDLFILVDGVNFDRASRTGGEEIRQWLADSQTKTVVIDHHETADKDNVDVFINNGSPSTTQDIYSICFHDLKLKQPPNAVDTALLGIYADTGGFVYLNDQHKPTFKLVSELLDKGGNIERVRYRLNSYTEDELRVFAELATNTTHDEDYTYSFISDEFVGRWAETGRSEAAMHKASKIFLDGFIRNIEGRRWGFITYKDLLEGGTMYSVSLRSANGIVDVSEIARKLNGGGHKAAAGGRVEADGTDEAIAKIKQAISEVRSSA